MALADRIAFNGTSMMVLLFLVVGAACAIATGTVADKKGYSYNSFAVIGFFLPVIGLIIAAVLPDKSHQAAKDAEALVSYKRLLDEGIITKADFEKKKRELLG